MTLLGTLEQDPVSSTLERTRGSGQICAERPLKIVHVITRLLLGGAEENTVATCLHQAA